MVRLERNYDRYEEKWEFSILRTYEGISYRLPLTKAEAVNLYLLLGNVFKKTEKEQYHED